jgi:hypothetical protein
MKGLEDSGNSEHIIEVCMSPEVVNEEVNDDCFKEDNTALNDEPLEDKEIMEIKKMAEAPIEEEAFVDEEKTEDLLKPEAQVHSYYVCFLFLF